MLESGQPVIGPSLAGKYPAVTEQFPSAEFVGRLAAKRAEFISASELEPVYLREVDFVKAPPLRVIPPV